MSSQKLPLAGKTAVVTGGAQGVGFGIAEKLSEDGAVVVLADLNVELARESAKALNDRGGQAIGLYADITKPDSLEALNLEILKTKASIDILVNNAGVVLRKTALETSEDEWKWIFDINVLGAIRAINALSPSMKSDGTGRIINICTAQVNVVEKNRGAYITTKTALAALTKVLAVDLAERGITVNGIAPGWTKTPMNQKALDGDKSALDYIQSKMPLARMAEPYEIGALAAYLASDAAGYMTGQILILDGGWTIW